MMTRRILISVLSIAAILTGCTGIPSGLKPVTGFEPGAMKLLLDHPWYGNVRQLENVVERAMVLAEGPLVKVQDLPDFIRHPETAIEGPSEALPADELSIKKQTADLERRLIGRALQVTDGNRTRAAELLDLSYRALLYKIRDYGLG